MKNFTSIIGTLLIIVLFTSCLAMRGGVALGSERLKYISSEFKSGPPTKASNTNTSSETGFYVGLQFTDIPISDELEFQPEVNFVSIKDLNQFHAPLLVKYSFADQFHALAGPNLGILLDTGEGVKSFNFGADLGLAYDVSEDFSIEARYNMGLSNLFENTNGDNSLKLSHFMLGIAYRFNK